MDRIEHQQRLIAAPRVALGWDTVTMPHIARVMNRNVETNLASTRRSLGRL